LFRVSACVVAMSRNSNETSKAAGVYEETRRLRNLVKLLRPPRKLRHGLQVGIHTVFDLTLSMELEAPETL